MNNYSLLVRTSGLIDYFIISCLKFYINNKLDLSNIYDSLATNLFKVLFIIFEITFFLKNKRRSLYTGSQFESIIHVIGFNIFLFIRFDELNGNILLQNFAFVNLYVYLSKQFSQYILFYLINNSLSIGLILLLSELLCLSLIFVNNEFYFWCTIVLI